MQEQEEVGEGNGEKLLMGQGEHGAGQASCVHLLWHQI